MGQYDFQAIEAKWQTFWEQNKTFAISEDRSKPKYYVLDMFPYPSGSGLHVGHPLGYIATDIIARYRRLRGYNVLHPMGYDAFGLPAEQYAIETGQHPAVTTEANVRTYQSQLRRIGLGFEPSSTDMRTCDPDYYKWTQWIFLQIFHSWYNKAAKRAEHINTLIAHFAAKGSAGVNAHSDFSGSFTAAQWKAMRKTKKASVLLQFRLAYTAFTEVNWCPALGTVLANDEVINGLSERGGHPVERKSMRQWAFRMRAYADRLLAGLDTLQWPEPIKEQQRNWIGRSEGARIFFDLDGHEGKLEVFSTRPDTIFGATFMVLAPEHPLLDTLTAPELAEDVLAYRTWARNRSEVERQQEKKITGKFTGAYALHPFIPGKKIPIWTADYVLWGYGTGAIMAVPAGDGRDYAFAKHFGLDIPNIFEGEDISEAAFEEKHGRLTQSGFLDGMEVKAAIPAMIAEMERLGIGARKVNYRLRDPNFSRQRYWGEPFPIVFRDGLPYALPESELPVRLPEVESYTPGGDGEGPLANLRDWVEMPDGSIRETNTMPGYAGSSWYFLRYFDVNNADQACDPEKEKYWMDVDLYVGGSEHAVGHLLYSRFWTQVLFDLGHVSHAEPFRRLVNQGMIQGRSSIMHRARGSQRLISLGRIQGRETDPIHVDVNIVENDILDIEALKQWRGGEYADYEFELEEDGTFRCGWQVEKMSKRYYNVVNPSDICDKHGADTLRLYEMFLGPLEDSKPWNTNGIEGSFRFLKKAWNLFTDEDNRLTLTDEEPNKEELRVLHATIGKIQHDIENLSMNTAVSQFMIFANEVTRLKCRKRAVLEPFLVLLAPFCPHIAEELWALLGHKESIATAPWPVYVADYTKSDTVTYPVQVNGKLRGQLELPADLDKAALEALVMEAPEIAALLQGQALKKLVVVPGRIVNLVV